MKEYVGCISFVILTTLVCVLFYPTIPAYLMVILTLAS